MNSQPVTLHRPPLVLRCRAAADEPPEMRCAIAAAGFDALDVATLAAGSVISMMVMPGGTHKITPTVNGRPQEVNVLVDAASAAELNKQLGILNAQRGHKRAFFDFDHEGKIASGWPVEFTWQNEPAPGVYAKVELSEAGAKAIAGKNYRAFSIAAPIQRGNPARIVASEACRELSLGGLVNDPAFATILPLWAKNAGAPSATANQEPNKNMTPEQIASLQAKNTELQAEITTLKAKQTRTELEAESLRAKQAELEANQARLEVVALKAKQAEQESIIKAQRTKDATFAVADAVARGVIPAQHDQLKARWQALCEADPANIELLKGMQSNPAIQPERRTSSGPITTVESGETMLAAYGKLQSPKERGLFYAREIAPRFAAAGGEFNIRAANALGSLVGNIISQRALDLLQEGYPWLRNVTTDFSDERANFGQTIITRTLTPPAATDYNTTTGYADSDATATDVSVALSSHKAVQMAFTANDVAGTNRRLIDEQAQVLQYAIGKSMADALGALILAANYANATTRALATFARQYVVDMATALSGRKVPTQGRILVLNAAYYGALFKDASIVNVALPQSFAALTGSLLPPIAGFAVHQWVDLPANAQNLTGFACTPDALVIAARLPNDYAAAANSPTTALQEVVTNPNTGFSVQLTRFVDHKLGKAYGRAAFMFGVAKGQAGSLERLISA